MLQLYAMAPSTPQAPVILLVDDDARIRDTAAEMLSGAGYAIMEAASGGEALDILASGRTIMMLITDQRMPGMTGTELIALVRDQTPTLPILLVTGDTGRSDDLETDIAFLEKPFREAGLLAAVSKQLTGRYSEAT
jgi:CheY-like chemotaxis protein